MSIDTKNLTLIKIGKLLFFLLLNSKQKVFENFDENKFNDSIDKIKFFRTR